jgi:hypothetical protein
LRVKRWNLATTIASHLRHDCRSPIASMAVNAELWEAP